jgi:hypothetical protein
VKRFSEKEARQINVFRAFSDPIWSGDALK